MDSTPLLFPQLASLYQTLGPWAEALLRVGVGLALVPHGLRMTFGFFPNTGLPVRNLAMLSAQLDRDGYRPGKLWAPLISLTQLVGGPMLALGLFTRAGGGADRNFPARVERASAGGSAAISGTSSASNTH